MKNLSKLILIVISFINISYTFSQPLNGTYTIGNGGDFSTIETAVSALVNNGVNGPVILNIIPGNYYESVVIDSIPGTSIVNTVTFQPQSADVFWHNASQDFVVKIINSDYLNFQFLSMETAGGFFSTGYIFYLTGHIDNLLFEGNVFKGIWYQKIGVYSLNGYLKNIVFRKNTFDCFTGIFITSVFQRNTGIMISGNSFTSNGVNGFFVSKCDSLIIINNLIKVQSDFGSMTGCNAINLQECNGFLRIEKNKIIALIYSRYLGSLGLVINNCNFSNSLIANNFFWSHCIRISNSSGINFYYNSLNASDLGDLTMICSNSYLINFKNNLVICKWYGTIYSNQNIIVDSSSINSDYNNFYYTTPTFGTYNSVTINDLNQWRQVTGGDFNSFKRYVTTVSDIDLHLTGSSIGDTNLAGIPIPEVVDDIDGDLRDPLKPYIGADEADITLPVNLISLSANVDRNNVTLSWSTLQEVNNSHFEIERIITTSNLWIKVGIVSGNGTTNSTHHYSFSERLSTGKYKYRLKQIDYNGSFEYFVLNEIIQIGVPWNFTLSQNYPNPFNPTTKFDYVLPYDGKINLKIYDMTGKEIMNVFDKHMTAGYYTEEFDGKNLSSGIYFYTFTYISDDKQIFKDTKRMILLK